MMNLLIERRAIGTQEDGTPLYELRIVVDNRDVRTPTDEQREAVLLAFEAFDQPGEAPKPEGETVVIGGIIIGTTKPADPK